MTRTSHGIECLEQVKTIGGSTQETCERGIVGKTVESLLTRFGVNACLPELNGNYIAGLNAPASAQGPKLFDAPR